MSDSALSCAAAVIALATTLVACRPAPPVEDGAPLAIYVRDACQMPARDAAVTVYDETGWWATGRTGRDGRVTIRVPRGVALRIRVAHPSGERLLAGVIAEGVDGRVVLVFLPRCEAADMPSPLDDRPGRLPRIIAMPDGVVRYELPIRLGPHEEAILIISFGLDRLTASIQWLDTPLV